MIRCRATTIPAKPLRARLVGLRRNAVKLRSECVTVGRTRVGTCEPGRPKSKITIDFLRTSGMRISHARSHSDMVRRCITRSHRSHPLAILCWPGCSVRDWHRGECVRHPGGLHQRQRLPDHPALGHANERVRCAAIEYCLNQWCCDGVRRVPIRQLRHRHRSWY